jgi:hypothetical protein
MATYGIEQSTDMRAPQTRIIRFRSKAAALKWRDERGGELTHDDPEAARNWHHTFRSVYVTTEGLPSRKAMEAMAFRESTSMYPKTMQDIMARMIFMRGAEVESS